MSKKTITVIDCFREILMQFRIFGKFVESYFVFVFTENALMWFLTFSEFEC